MASIGGDNNEYLDAMRRALGIDPVTAAEDRESWDRLHGRNRMRSTFGNPIWTRTDGWAGGPRGGPRSRSAFNDYVDQVIGTWTEAQVHDCIRAISAGDACIGCGGAWRPDITPNQRLMAHRDDCPYVVARDRLGV